MGDELRGAIMDAHGCWASFEVLRGSDDPPFDAVDAALMRAAARILGARLRRARVGAVADARVAAGRTGCS